MLNVARSATIVSFPVFEPVIHPSTIYLLFGNRGGSMQFRRKGGRKKEKNPSSFRILPVNNGKENPLSFIPLSALKSGACRRKEERKENEVARRVAAAVQKPEPISIHPKKISSTLPICYYMSPAASKFRERERERERERGRDGGKKKRRVKTARAKKPIPTEKRGSHNYEQMPRFSFISKI